MYKLSFLLSLIILLLSCGSSETPLPKPRLYPKIDLPEKSYSRFDRDYCALSFDFPNYGVLIQDSLFFEEKPLDPCWFDIQMKSINAQLHCSYIPIENRTHFDKLVKDAFRMSGEHNAKAEYRDDKLIKNPQGIEGVLFEIDGPVASPVQFFLTDSTQHFFRSSLYFNAKPEPDSLAPVLAFVKEDISRMIDSFTWE